MKKYKLFLAIMMMLSFSAYSSDKEITQATVSPKPEHNTLKTPDLHNYKSNQRNMKFSVNNATAKKTIQYECGRGYVVGLFTNMNVPTQGWAVWLSKTGSSWKNKDVQIYWAYGELVTNSELGKRAYASILAAQASGQEVLLSDITTETTHCAKSQIWTTSSDNMNGPQFNSVEIWFP
ncbi:hypothetical protein [Xenorhabdus szentirmaii]|uniref:Uncharacterized protein n=2 Tax=Xenorhabdus szentirmaii TaxID=290112 RepID=W1IZF8_9GAMM|nr:MULTISPECIES: hypothetical protein [Xenorhabdus]MBD2781687.1 hypothetical protein [Xenorhabdus sp. 38]MBD2790877.1 hypothetical protein [Xenorhabdus sp. CUL]MBD2802371.1 hypothetical protein [Xenorhabdus sp. M]MBD2804431.1 hypothetical protein [Xenorhabdus sp. ZM]MBD2819921.1 hypothetical protein [Xenorhabdus sp. 42]